MAQNPFNTRNKQSTNSGLNRGVEVAQKSASAISAPYYAGRALYVEGQSVYREAQKFILSEKGVIRQMSEAGGGVRSGESNTVDSAGGNVSRADMGLNSERNTQRTLDATSGANDPINDPIFICGDIYMPLNINFTISGQKIVAESQLVDGINIYERIANAPQTINVSFIIQRLEGNSQWTDQATTMQTTDRAPLYKLTRFIQDLYRKDEVFEIVNTVLNNEFGVSYAFIKSYNFIPQQGSTFASVSFTLQEVNIQDPLLYTNPANATEYGQVSTTANPNG